MLVNHHYHVNSITPNFPPINDQKIETILLIMLKSRKVTTLYIKIHESQCCIDRTTLTQSFNLISNLVQKSNSFSTSLSHATQTYFIALTLSKEDVSFDINNHYKSVSFCDDNPISYDKKDIKHIHSNYLKRFRHNFVDKVLISIPINSEHHINTKNIYCMSQSHLG